MFSGNFLRAGYPSRVQVKFKDKKKTVFITILGLKDCDGFKGRQDMSNMRWYRSRFLQTLVVIFPRKSTQVKIHTKIAIFWLVFSTKNPVKSDKLALIEGKILNLMFLGINIPVVPTEIWLRVTHNQRQKTPKVASVLLFRHILKTKSWLECGFSLLNSRMWPGILRDVGVLVGKLNKKSKSRGSNFSLKLSLRHYRLLTVSEEHFSQTKN